MAHGPPAVENQKLLGFRWCSPVVATGLAIRLALIVILLSPCVVQGQARGVYPLGMSALNSGLTPEAGFTYSNLFLFYSRSHFRDANGGVIATGENSVMMDMNSFLYVTNKSIRFLGGAVLSFSATLPIANNSLTSDIHGPQSGGGGFADSYYQPLILGWRKKRLGFRAIYGFLAPTGRFKAGANDNVGSGYWTHVGASGQTLNLTDGGGLVASAFQMYEFHTTQEGTGIHPGETFSLDYSIMGSVWKTQSMNLQAGLVGYEQRQTSAKTGAGISLAQSQERYAINSLGFAVNAAFPSRKTNVGGRYFKEFSNRSTNQGYSFQVSASIGF
jgi:hypothetical protein